MVIAGRYVMGTKYNPKKDRQIEAVSEAGKALGLKHARSGNPVPPGEQ